MAMLLSFKPRSPLSVVKKKVSFDLSRPTTKDSPKLTKQIRSYDVNQLVWVNLNRPILHGVKVKYQIGRVVKKISDIVYMVKLTDNTLHKVHINQLRECYSNVNTEKGLLLVPVLNKVIPVVSHQKPLSAQSSP